MEQKDYLLREIEKLGAILNAIKQKFLGGKANSAIPLEKQIENEKRMLSDEMNFDTDKVLSLSLDELHSYISEFKAFNIENVELLAECFSQIGLNGNGGDSKEYLEKALQLYEICNSKSKTYSFEREEKIKALKNILK